MNIAAGVSDGAWQLICVSFKQSINFMLNVSYSAIEKIPDIWY